MENEYIIIFITAGSEDEAAGIGKGLIENNLAPCANLVRSLRSIYRWKGRIYDEEETLIIVKTRKSLFEKVKDYVKRNHSYEVPEIIAFPIISGLTSYLQWIDENTKPLK